MGNHSRINLPSQELLKEHLRYDPDTGQLWWKVKVVNRKMDVPVGTWDNKYLRVKFQQRYYQAHRLIWQLVHGECPESLDHIDGNRRNNRLSNLRPCDTASNAWNEPLRSTNTTGIKGLQVNGKGWRGQILHRGKIYSKRFPKDQKEAAIEWLKAKREELHGDFCNHG